MGSGTGGSPAHRDAPTANDATAATADQHATASTNRDSLPDWHPWRAHSCAYPHSTTVAHTNAYPPLSYTRGPRFLPRPP